MHLFGLGAGMGRRGWMHLCNAEVSAPFSPFGDAADAVLSPPVPIRARGMGSRESSDLDLGRSPRAAVAYWPSGVPPCFWEALSR